ncbi:NADH dehydrogenase [ubiquinone] flavoprotein 3, mitochondrial isoform X3, partial [Silurus meridionalis]
CNNIRSTKMATSLLRLGRLGLLKCHRQDGWGSLRTPLTAAFCTKADAPKKAAKKAQSKTSEAPDERAALLAYKTAVAFPTRISTPGFLSHGVALGEHEQSTDPVTGESAAASSHPAAGAEPTPTTPQVSSEASIEETVNAVDAKQTESAKDEPESGAVGAGDTTLITETATEKEVISSTRADMEAPKSKVAPKDDDTTSSSSSSSDSDSDSDSDDEKPDKTEEIASVVQTKHKAGQKGMPSAGSEASSLDMKIGAGPERETKEPIKGQPEVTKIMSKPTPEEVLAPSTSVSSEEVIDPAPVICTAESVKVQSESIPVKEAGVEVKSSEVSDALSEPATKAAQDISAKPTLDVVLDSATEMASEPETKAAPEPAKCVDAAEELVDSAPIITDAEEVRAKPEATAAHEEAAAAPAAPAPEPEPFDNTTYKNLQHHNYNTYTFVDMDVEMAKHRLPQPSTGRHSPR